MLVPFDGQRSNQFGMISNPRVKGHVCKGSASLHPKGSSPRAPIFWELTTNALGFDIERPKFDMVTHRGREVFRGSATQHHKRAVPQRSPIFGTPTSAYTV